MNEAHTIVLKTLGDSFDKLNYNMYNFMDASGICEAKTHGKCRMRFMKFVRSTCILTIVMALLKLYYVTQAATHHGGLNENLNRLHSTRERSILEKQASTIKPLMVIDYSSDKVRERTGKEDGKQPASTSSFSSSPPSPSSSSLFEGVQSSVSEGRIKFSPHFHASKLDGIVIISVKETEVDRSELSPKVMFSNSMHATKQLPFTNSSIGSGSSSSQQKQQQQQQHTDSQDTNKQPASDKINFIVERAQDAKRISHASFPFVRTVRSGLSTSVRRIVLNNDDDDGDGDDDEMPYDEAVGIAYGNKWTHSGVNHPIQFDKMNARPSRGHHRRKYATADQSAGRLDFSTSLPLLSSSNVRWFVVNERRSIQATVTGEGEAGENEPGDDDGDGDGDGDGDVEAEDEAEAESQQPDGQFGPDNESPERHRADSSLEALNYDTGGGNENFGLDNVSHNRTNNMSMILDGSSLNRTTNENILAATLSSINIIATTLSNNLVTTAKVITIQPCTTLDDIQAKLPSLIFRVVFLGLYGIVYTFGWIGNALTLYVIFKNRDKPIPVINMFIANLAISDMMVCSFSVPVTPIYLLYHGHWVFGPLLCKIFAFVMSASIYVSTFTLINIAFLRYWMIQYPHKGTISILIASLMNLCAWILAFIITLPYSLQVGLVPKTDCPIKFCDEQWSQPIHRFWFSIATLILQFFLPFIAVTFFYGSVFRKLRQRNRQHKQNQQQPKPPTSQQQLLNMSRHNNDSSSYTGCSNNNNNNNNRNLIIRSQLGENNCSPIQAEPHSTTGAIPIRRSIEPIAIRRNSLQEPVIMEHCMTGSGGGGGGCQGLDGSQLDDELDIQTAGQASNLVDSDWRPVNVNGLNGQQQTGGVHLNRATSYAPDGIQEEPFGLTVLGFATSLRQLTSMVMEQPDLAQNSSVSVGPINNQSRNNTKNAATTTTSINTTNTTTSLSDIIALRERKIRERNKRQSQTNRKLLYMVALFVCSWLPLNLFNVINDYFRILARWRYVKHGFLTCHIIACTSVCYNPILYAWMSDNYRQELREVLPNFLVRRLKFLQG